ncbi:MAG TPA: hypothetical protein PLN94_15345, partial [Thiolinea sp.]|nr:hypothetical protein [Thiolinea sp.]
MVLANQLQQHFTIHFLADADTEALGMLPLRGGKELLKAVGNLIGGFSIGEEQYEGGELSVCGRLLLKV